MQIFKALKSFPAVLLSGLLLAAPLGRIALAEETGPTVLTVTGAVSESNRPPFDPFADSLFAYHELKFEKAYSFDRAALSALPQVELVANATNWQRPVSASGPRLADVLAKAGVAPEAGITLVALDGYAVELTAAERQAKDWVLALSADGAPLSIGGRGPLWLLDDTGGEALTDDGDAKWIYSIFTVKAE